MHRSEDEDVVIPHEGSKIGPTPQPVADGIRLKAKSQLSGCLEFGGALAWGQQVGGPAAAAPVMRLTKYCSSYHRALAC